VRAALGWPALAIGLFFLAAWIGSSLPRNSCWREPGAKDRDAVEIMVESNGTHTALVLPLATAGKDWRPVFPAADLAEPLRPYSHVSVSWGDRTVFLDTPTWADLTPATVAHIVFGGGEALLHVAHYVRPAPAAGIRPVRLTRTQYRALVRRVEAALPLGATARYPGYGGSDVFYAARGRYTPARNCNQWTSDSLAAAGVRTGRWTPFAGGVMKWVPPLAR
jgi:uncharacterized protein (TIGR02117 family)